VIRKGSENETNSYFPRELFDIVRFLPGVARSEDNQPLAAGELIVVINHVRKDGSESNFVVRGTSETGFRLRPGIRVVQGRKFRPGLREIIVGGSLSRRFRNLVLGDTLEVHGAHWKVVGIFDSSGDAHESEVWTGYQDVADVWQRPTWSSVLVRADSADSARKLTERISGDRRIQLDALTTKTYYAGQTAASAIGLKPLITLIALFLGIGSCFDPSGKEVLIASGYVVAHHKHELGSKVMGRVKWIGVEKGDLVRKGQLLVKLEDREYRAQLAQAEAELSAAQESLAALEAGSRPQEIARAEAELTRANSDLGNARLEFQRLRELLEVGVISDQQVDNAKARFEMAEALAASARQTLDLLKQGPRAEEIRQARSEVQRAVAAVDYAQTMLDATEIRAPVSGTVLRRIAEVGEMITTSFAGESGAKSAVIALADLGDLQVELDISQADFNRITPDLGCRMTPEAYADRSYPCEVQEVSPEANRQKASIQIKVKVLAPDEYLRPEMSAQVAFLKIT